MKHHGQVFADLKFPNAMCYSKASTLISNQEAALLKESELQKGTHISFVHLIWFEIRKMNCEIDFFFFGGKKRREC